MIKLMLWKLGGFDRDLDQAFDRAMRKAVSAIKVAALAELRAGDVLPGGKLMVVPVEPTEKMLQAATMLAPTWGHPEQAAKWAAMLAAAKGDWFTDLTKLIADLEAAECPRCKEWQRLGLSSTCPDCDAAALRARQSEEQSDER